MSEAIYMPAEYTKVAFFDMDGVLSIPRYLYEGRLCAGGSFEWWRNYNASGEYTYKDCLRPRKVYELVSRMRRLGIKTYVLSVEAFLDCRPNKIRFAKEQYDFSDDEIIFVDQSDMKLPYLLKYAKDNSLELKAVYFIDDTYSLVLDAVTEGFDAHHIAELLEVG